jgi:hypothetical protein
MTDQTDQTDPLEPHDPGGPLTSEEKEHIRRILRDDDRRSWALKQIMVLTPIAVGVVTVVYQLWDWVRSHVSFK